jgi:hypothetical protein
MHIFKDAQIDENNKASASMNLDLLHSGLKGLEPGILNTANGRSKYIPGWNSFATANSLAKILAHVCTWDSDYLHGMLCSDESTSQESWGLGIQSFGEGLGGYEAFGGSLAIFSPQKKLSVFISQTLFFFC